MTLIQKGEGVLILIGGAAEFVTRIPRPCPVCGTMAAWFRNQDGITRCIHCAIHQEARHVSHSVELSVLR